MPKYYEHKADYAFPPGESLLEILEYSGLSQEWLAKKLDRSQDFVSDLIEGKAAITPEIAALLNKALNTPESLWINLQKMWDRYQAKGKAAE